MHSTELLINWQVEQLVGHESQVYVVVFVIVMLAGHDDKHCS